MNFKKPAISEMEERKEPKFVTFAEGESVDGVLTNIETNVVVSGNAVTRYTVYNPTEDESYSFLGTFQLNAKLRTADKGRYVAVQCCGADQNAGRNGNAMKLFKVLVQKAPVNNHGLGITDDDLPAGL